MMVQANFRQVFVGLESPRAESLIETLKFQNTRGDSLLEKIGRIRDGGLVLQAGFIVGFDNDDPRIFDEQYEFEESGVGQAMVSILTPIPTTPLYDRLKAEGRLNYTDPEVAFVPKLMTQAELRTGHADLIRRLYEAPFFRPRFQRLPFGHVSRATPSVGPRRRHDGLPLDRHAQFRGPARRFAAGARVDSEVRVLAFVSAIRSAVRQRRSRNARRAHAVLPVRIALPHALALL